ncbi:hypothetical protein GCM10009425_12260 [Pseudomonas asuensis]|uniref:Uncharacterized protein n=1 Tax=Pseudomonas asuensis TaxID=1825787 RepID=A0ABQ2GMJ8_9PSED|nr:hypothetical protein GCM10009425_12260 [Pseudomonas asuensis]
MAHERENGRLNTALLGNISLNKDVSQTPDSIRKVFERRSGEAKIGKEAECIANEHSESIFNEASLSADTFRTEPNTHYYYNGALMSTWVLLVVTLINTVNNHGDKGTSPMVAMQEFNSQKTCMDARTQLIKMNPAISASCVLK